MTPAAPTAPAGQTPLPRAARRELARADVQAELTKLLVHGFGSMLVKIHDHRITLVETTARLLEGQGEEVDGVTRKAQRGAGQKAVR